MGQRYEIVVVNGREVLVPVNSYPTPMRQSHAPPQVYPEYDDYPQQYERPRRSKRQRKTKLRRKLDLGWKVMLYIVISFIPAGMNAPGLTLLLWAIGPVLLVRAAVRD